MPRSEHGNSERSNDSALVRASLVVADFERVHEGAAASSMKGFTGTTEAGGAQRPPRTPKRNDAVAQLYSAGNRKRSLGVGRISYHAGEDKGMPQKDGEKPYPPRPRSSSPHFSSRMLPAQTAQTPLEFRHRSSGVEGSSNVSRPASASNRNNIKELQNLRDWNHTLAYELNLERSDLADIKLKCDSSAQEVFAHSIFETELHTIDTGTDVGCVQMARSLDFMKSFVQQQTKRKSRPVLLISSEISCKP